MKAVLLYQGDVAYVFKVSRFTPAPEKCKPERLFVGDHARAVMFAEYRLTRLRWGFKTAVCEIGADPLRAHWDFRNFLVLQPGLQVVTTRKNQKQIPKCLRVKDNPSRNPRPKHTYNTPIPVMERQSLKELRSMPYREYLKTSWWKERRSEALHFAGNRCQICNASGCQLDVHHRTYERRGKEQQSDLIVLCHDCHELFHKNGKLAFA